MISFADPGSGHRIGASPRGFRSRVFSNGAIETLEQRIRARETSSEASVCCSVGDRSCVIRCTNGTSTFLVYTTINNSVYKRYPNSPRQLSSGCSFSNLDPLFVHRIDDAISNNRRPYQRFWARLTLRSKVMSSKVL